MSTEQKTDPWHEHAKLWMPDQEVVLFTLVSTVSIVSLILYVSYP